MKRLNKIFISALTLLAVGTSYIHAGPFDILKDPRKLENIIDTGTKAIDTIDKIDRAAEPITPKDAYSIGRTVGASVLSSRPLYRSSTATMYVNRIARAIAMNSPVPVLYKDYCVGILDSNEINAISTSSGMILISRGLLASAESEDEIAAVIAHEMAHIQLEHSINMIKANRKKEAVVSSVKLADDVTGKYSKMSASDKQMFHDLSVTGNYLTVVLTDTGYPKEQEYKADQEALYLLLDAGYDPNALISMLQKLDASFKEHSGEGGWTKTHPKPADRIKKAQKTCSSLKYEGADPSVRAARFKACTKGL